MREEILGRILFAVPGLRVGAPGSGGRERQQDPVRSQPLTSVSKTGDNLAKAPTSLLMPQGLGRSPESKGYGAHSTSSAAS